MSTTNSKKDKDLRFAELWTSFKNKGNPEAREKLITEYLYLVKYSAGRIAVSLPSYVEIDDLFAAGFLGLIQAVEKYDPKRLTKFETYAVPRIRGAMLDELRNQDWFPRSIRHKAKLLEAVLSDIEIKLGRPASDVDVANYLNISLEEYYKLLDEVSVTCLISLDHVITSNHEGLYSVIGESLPHANAVDPFEMLEMKEILEIIRETLDNLPEKERLVLALYYYEELTLKEIGKVLRVTESRVCQIHTKALLKLKGRVNRLLGGLHRKKSKVRSKTERKGEYVEQKLKKPEGSISR